MMNWRKPVIFCLLYLSGSKIPKYLKEIERIDKLSLEEKKKYQENKLKKLLLYSYKNVPYYNKVLKEAGVVIDGRVHLENFSNIPILTKDIIRREGKNLFSKEKRKGVYENSSGGSTGEPVRLLQDKEYYEWNIANKIYIKKRYGQDIGDKELRLWGSERDILQGQEKLSIRLRNWLYNRKEFNAFRMSENDMIRFVKEWNKFKPKWVEAYVQSIYEFGRFVKENNFSIYSPKGIVTTAGTLYPHMKEFIEEVFNCQVINRYGSREVGDMAYSEKNILKLFVHTHFIEILNNELKQSKEGNVYVTLLTNYSMPLIRYKVGDIAIKESLFSLKSIKGREVDIFKTKNSELIDGEYFTHLFYLKDWIKKFQVIQKDYDLIEIKVILKDKKKFEKDRTQIEKSIKKVMGECRIEWKLVKDIPPLKSGKFMYVVREIE